MRDYYIVLGVGRGADRDKIQKAYRAVVKKYHPDVTLNREGAGKFL
ncbi:MAG: DnaJ domain-containing protein, partial [Syntrophaceae bacterium]|nr:DnaJ domain-containing protein [Syntrophaceae bacterium]